MKDIKSETKNVKIIEIGAPDILIFPIMKSLGNGYESIVEIGDSVKMGQKIAEAKSQFAVPIHSSVSGKVVAIEKKMMPNSIESEAIIIENDRQDTLEDSVFEKKYKRMMKNEIIENIKESGIVGMGGAGFPTYLKLMPQKNKHVENLIINGCECEPLLTADYRTMLERPKEIILGIKILMKCLNVFKAYIAVEANNEDAIEILKTTIAQDAEADIKVFKVKAKYPQGSEKQLIETITGKRVPRGKYPIDVQTVVNNVETCVAVAEAFKEGIPLIKRVVTVGGDCFKNPSNFIVRIGTPFSYVLEKAGGYVTQPDKIIMGGHMTGIAVPSTDVPIIKTTTGIIALSKLMTELDKAGACLKCGKCVSACPMGLVPNVLNKASDKDDLKKLEEYHFMDCIECGTCAYVCPAGINQVESIKRAKLKSRLNKS